VRSFALLAGIILASPANAIELSCTLYGMPRMTAWCEHPTAEIPGWEVLFDQPGNFTTALTFDAPLTDDLAISGHRLLRHDVYDDLGKLVLAVPLGGETFLNELIAPAGSESFSFGYSIPDYTWDGRTSSFKATSSMFQVSGPVSGISFHVSSPNAVPEPSSWAMLIAGFGFIGIATRRMHRSVELPHSI
jgi:hypothetical protein